MTRSGRTSQVPTHHEVKNVETIQLILECITKVDKERMVDLSVALSLMNTDAVALGTYLLKQMPFLNDARHRLLFDTLLLIDVLESVGRL